MERKMVLIVEVVIQFYDAVVAIACARYRREIVVRCCRQAGNRAWPKGGKQRIGYRAFRYALSGELISCEGQPARRRFRGPACQAEDVLLLLKTTEEECLIFDNRAAHREPIVFIPEPGCFRKLGARYEEGRLCRIKFIPVVIVGRAVQCVAAALEDQVRRAPCVA